MLSSADPSDLDMHCYPITHNNICIKTDSSPLTSALGKLKAVHLVPTMMPANGTILLSSQPLIATVCSFIRTASKADKRSFFPIEEFSLSLIAAAAEINKQTDCVVVYYFSCICLVV